MGKKRALSLTLPHPLSTTAELSPDRKSNPPSPVFPSYAGWLVTVPAHWLLGYCCEIIQLGTFQLLPSPVSGGGRVLVRIRSLRKRASHTVQQLHFLSANKLAKVKFRFHIYPHLHRGAPLWFLLPPPSLIHPYAPPSPPPNQTHTARLHTYFLGEKRKLIIAARLSVSLLPRMDGGEEEEE